MIWQRAEVLILLSHRNIQIESSGTEYIFLHYMEYTLTLYEVDEKLKNMFLRSSTAQKEGSITIVRKEHPNRKGPLVGEELEVMSFGANHGVGQVLTVYYDISSSCRSIL